MGFRQLLARASDLVASATVDPPVRWQAAHTAGSRVASGSGSRPVQAAQASIAPTSRSRSIPSGSGTHAWAIPWAAVRTGVWPDNQNGTFPFNRDSTAFAVDYIGGELRGCYEGWESWLKTTGTRTYAAGDLWGCVGTWYAGAWHTGDADSYIDQVQRFMQSRPWLEADWSNDKPGCTSAGCPGPDPL